MITRTGKSPRLKRVPIPGISGRAGASMVLIGLMFIAAMVFLWHPERALGPAKTLPSLAPMGSSRPVLPDTEVTRGDDSMLAPLPVRASSAISLPALITSDHVSTDLRQPLRLLHSQQPPMGLRELVRHTLSGFGHDAGEGDPLFGLLVQLLAEGQSNRYIGAALQLAHDQGRVALPAALIGEDGALDIDTLLGGLIYMNAAEAGIPAPTAQARRNAPQGSLAALILRD